MILQKYGSDLFFSCPQMFGRIFLVAVPINSLPQILPPFSPTNVPTFLPTSLPNQAIFYKTPILYGFTYLKKVKKILENG